MLNKVAFIILVIGGLNWLLVGLFGWDIGQLFGGMESWVSRIIYIIIGLSAFMVLYSNKGMMKGRGGMESPAMDQGGQM
jgi:uncharacterized membrane protein YuzA (DUF378 family)